MYQKTLTKMTKSRFQRYKRNYGTIPRCLSCGSPIFVGEKIEVRHGCYKHKYLCKNCLKKDIVVYQYPKSKPANKIEKKWFI
jgi:NAD-dependent SIR2 family protein deacetylase